MVVYVQLIKFIASFSLSLPLRLFELHSLDLTWLHPLKCKFFSFYLSFSFLAVQDKRGKKNERKEEKTSLGPIFFFFCERKRKCITWNAAFNSYTWNTMTFFCFCVTIMMIMITTMIREAASMSIVFFIFFRICFMTRQAQTTKIPMVYRTKVSLVLFFYPWIFFW